MANFTNNTAFKNEKENGIIVGCEHEGYRFGLHVWVDNSEKEGITLRTTLDDSPNSLILVTVSPEDFIEPTVTYSDDKTYCYVTFNNNSLHIKLESEGVVLDVWDCEDDQNGSIDTNYIFYNELLEVAD